MGTTTRDTARAPGVPTQASQDTYCDHEQQKSQTYTYKHYNEHTAHETTATTRTSTPQGENTSNKEHTTELTCPGTNPYNSTETTDEGIYFFYNKRCDKPEGFYFFYYNNFDKSRR
jgi:hypothetical protein